MGADPRAEAQKYAARVDFQAICYKLSAAMLESRPEGETHMRTAYSTANTTAASPVHLSFFLPGTPYFPFFSSAPHNLFRQSRARHSKKHRSVAGPASSSPSDRRHRTRSVTPLRKQSPDTTSTSSDPFLTQTPSRLLWSFSTK